MAYETTRAIELGKLIEAAYAQLNNVPTWQPPGYTLGPVFTAQEPWRVAQLTAQASQVMAAMPHLGALPFQMPHLQMPHWPAAGIPLPQGFSIPHFQAPHVPLTTALPFGFVATKDRDVFVVIRGTQTPLEWLADFTILPVPVKIGTDWGNTTAGFKNIYEQIGPTILSAIEPLAKAGTLGTVYVTGHSLGAALAHLAAAEIAEAVGGSRVVAYTFSGPRAGDPAFAARYARAGIETHRIFNTEDLVPTLPLAAIELTPGRLGLNPASAIGFVLQHLLSTIPNGLYQHVGEPRAVTFHRGNVADNHNLTNTYQALAAADQPASPSGLENQTGTLVLGNLAGTEKSMFIVGHGLVEGTKLKTVGKDLAVATTADEAAFESVDVGGIGSIGTGITALDVGGISSLGEGNTSS